MPGIKLEVQYIITKIGKEEWFFYSSEELSYGIRILWTSKLKNALVFTTMAKAETFKSKYLSNANVNIRRFTKTEPWFS